MYVFLDTTGSLVNINASVRNAWKTQGKVREFDEDWSGATQCVCHCLCLCVWVCRMRTG